MTLKDPKQQEEGKLEVNNKTNNLQALKIKLKNQRQNQRAQRNKLKVIKNLDQGKQPILLE